MAEGISRQPEAQGPIPGVGSVVSYAALAAVTLLVGTVVMLGAPRALAQGAGGGGAPSPRASAPVDLTGYWVSLVTEDWIERMSPDSPPSGVGGVGGFGGRGGTGVPASADPCRAYAAGGSMRMPGRLNISWADDNTLQVELDQGTQTRVFHFDSAAPASEAESLQGFSTARWLVGGGGRGGRGGRGGGAPPAWGALEVVTTHLAGGYLLTSKSNYAAGTVLTEVFAHHEDFGQEYLTVVASLEGGPTTSSTFRKEPNGDNFSPTGCTYVPQD